MNFLEKNSSAPETLVRQDASDSSRHDNQDDSQVGELSPFSIAGFSHLAGPGREINSQPVDEQCDEISDYLNDLLARTQGFSSSSKSAPADPPAKTAVLKKSPPPKSYTGPKEAPERHVSFSSMREVANLTAREGIERFFVKKLHCGRRDLVLAAAATSGSLCLTALSETVSSPLYWCAAGALLIGVLFCFRFSATLRSVDRTLR